MLFPSEYFYSTSSSRLGFIANQLRVHSGFKSLKKPNRDFLFLTRTQKSQWLRFLQRNTQILLENTKWKSRNTLFYWQVLLPSYSPQCFHIGTSHHQPKILCEKENPSRHCTQQSCTHTQGLHLYLREDLEQEQVQEHSRKELDTWAVPWECSKGSARKESNS